MRPLPEGPPTEFYPRALERSERALKLAIAEMYLRGVSTRRVTEITRELCGLDVTSTQVSRATALLDAELEAWRTRDLGRCPYLNLDARYEKVRHGGTVSRRGRRAAARSAREVPQARSEVRRVAEEAIPQGLTVFALAPEHQRRLRTTTAWSA